MSDYQTTTFGDIQRAAETLQRHVMIIHPADEKRITQILEQFGWRPTFDIHTNALVPHNCAIIGKKP